MWLYLLILVLSLVFSVQIGAPFNTIIDHAPSLFGPKFNGTAITGKLVVANPYSGCGELENNVQGSIVLVEKPKRQRHCDYAWLVYSIELKGAKGVIVADDQKRGFLEFMKSYNQSLVDKIHIPSVFIHKSSSHSLLSFHSIDSELTVIIDDKGEVRHQKFLLTRTLCSIYVFILLLLWCSTIVFYSDCCIIRRTLSHHSHYSNQILQYSYHIKELCDKGIIRDVEEGDECAICLESFHEGDNVKLMRCHHYFHSECIDPWLTKHSNLCPICKITVFEMDGTCETKLQKEMNRQQCLFSFWMDFFIINFLLFLLIL